MLFMDVPFIIGHAHATIVATFPETGILDEMCGASENREQEGKKRCFGAGKNKIIPIVHDIFVLSQE